MEHEHRQVFYRKVLRVLSYATFLLPLPPTALYFWARHSGALPSPGEWAEAEINHGPWWDAGYGQFYDFAYLAMAALPYATFCYAVYLSNGEKKGKAWTFCRWSALAFLQFLIGFWVLDLTYWAVG